MLEWAMFKSVNVLKVVLAILLVGFFVGFGFLVLVIYLPLKYAAFFFFKENDGQ